MAHPLRAIFHTRDKIEHEKRRQVWSPGFSTRSLKDYEPRIESHISRLIQQLRRKPTEEGVNVSLWFNYFTFDVMGDVGFGQGFSMIEKGKRLDVLRILENGQKGLGVFGVVPWLFMMLTRIPNISKEHDVFVRWCEQQILDRKSVSRGFSSRSGNGLNRCQRKTDVCDIAAALITDDRHATDKALSHQWLVGDSRILIVAGSDALASSLTFAFYYLAKDPKHILAIREELNAITAGTVLDAESLRNKAAYLNAFITEVLRLWPPNPSGVLRQTLEEGLQIGKKRLPGDITICTPFWVLHRCEYSSRVPPSEVG